MAAHAGSVPAHLCDPLRDVRRAPALLSHAVCSPPIALALGLALALTIGHPFRTSTVTKILLQISVVGLGFGMNLQKVVEAGRTGILFTIATILGTLLLGYAIGRAMRISRGTAHLISSGTAICGGSAIAAVGPVIGATDEEMSVSLGTVFILNAIALFAFPAIGAALHLTQTQFGVWSAIAIHDTSSVVGAASSYGAGGAADRDGGEARARSLDRAADDRHRVRVSQEIDEDRDPVVHPLLPRRRDDSHVLPESAFAWDFLVRIARVGLTVTLFLIGASLSRRSLAAVGVRPLILGVVLWILISAAGLWGVLATLA